MSNTNVPSTTSLSTDSRCSSLDRDDRAIPISESVPPGAEHPPNALTTLPLLVGKTTLAEALEEEENMLFRLAYPSQRIDFYCWIHEHREDLNALVSLHLDLANNETCRFGEFREWRHGSFNVCVPVYIDNWRKHPKKRVVLRLPLPYKVGESTHPGNADEKLRTEVAAFIWIQDHCPDIAIPFLWGFGFPGGQSV